MMIGLKGVIGITGLRLIFNNVGMKRAKLRSVSGMLENEPTIIYRLCITPFQEGRSPESLNA